jgi:2'-5' RNA ligase
MDLKEHYHALYQDSIKKIQSDAYSIDQLIDSKNDKRFGITLLIRPDHSVKDRIQKFLSEIRSIEPNQYYYPDPDIHVTVISIISCYAGFNLGKIKVDDYIEIIKNSLKGMSRFKIEFKGLTASPSCLMVQGFPENNTLNEIRDNLRISFKDSGLEQSMDIRYAIQTAHMTIFRLKGKFENKKLFLKKTEAYRNFYFGTSMVDSMVLVYNDWYHREDRVKELYRYAFR